MRIIQLIQKPQLRGAEMFVSQLSNHLVEQGHEVLMVALFSGPGGLPFTGELIVLDRPVSKRIIDITGWRQLAALIRRFRPDVVQANAGDTLKFAAMSRLLCRWRQPLVFRNANLVSDFVKSWPKRLVNQFYVRNVQHVISVSERCRQDFVSTYHYPNADTTTVTIGIELNAYPTAIPADLSELFKGRVAVNVASMVPEKNQAGLLRIFRALSAKYADLKLLIVGDGRLRPQLDQLVHEMGLSDKVVLAGYRKDVLALLSNATVMMMPSLIEGLPGVILEAFYCRCPVVAYDVGGVGEVIHDGQTGRLLKKGDEAGFAAAVSALLDQPQLNANLQQQAFGLVTDRFANVTIARDFAKVYSAVAHQH